MSKLAFISHPIYSKHDTGSDHPEKPSRLKTIENQLLISGLYKKIEKLEPVIAEKELISLSHDLKYIEKIQFEISNGKNVLDHGDTIVCKDSFDVACTAVGAVIKAIDLIYSNDFNKVFCAVRPPGHHAEYDHAKGFCIFNNIAIAARYSQKIGAAEKVLIIDWDVHHGNGTQHIFENDNTVFYYSIHQFPYYPGTGSENEIGIENGKGFTFNRPMKSGSNDSDYLNVFKNDMDIIQKIFHPDIILISAGFDAHIDEPLAGIQLTENGYLQMTEVVTKLAWKYCDGKILSVLEGGYNLEALALCVETHLDILLKH